MGVGSPLGLAAGGYVSLEKTVTGWISERKLRPSIHIGLAAGDSVQMSDPPVQMGKLRPRESKWLFPNHASGGRAQAKSQVLPTVTQYVPDQSQVSWAGDVPPFVPSKV